MSCAAMDDIVWLFVSEQNGERTTTVLWRAREVQFAIDNAKHPQT